MTRQWFARIATVFGPTRRGFTSALAPRRNLSSLLTTALLVVGASACSDSTAPPATGSITVQLDGLPSGAATQVSIVQGAKSRVLSASSTVDGLDEGVWTITATDVTVDGLIYAPLPLSQSVSVAARSVGSARVLWTPTTGSMALSIAGLPTGTNGDVLLTGPGVSRVLTSSALMTALAPGQYEVQARDVRAATGTLRSVLPSQLITVNASAIPVAATVLYGPAPAAVDINVSGLPGGSNSAIMVTNPVGVPIAVATTTRLSPVVPGRWQLSAANVFVGGFTYAPSPASRDTVVSAGDTLRLPITYSLINGALAIAVTGLPQGAAGSVRVTGPGSYSQTLTGTTTLTGLIPGTYTVQADSVVRSALAYRPVQTTQQVVVSASLIAAPATVAYAPVVGTLVVTISGTPVGALGSVRITGPYGFDQTVSGNTLLSTVAAGPYTLTAAPVLHLGVPYEVSPAIVNKTVVINGRDSVDLRYQNVAGSLQVTVNGLSGGVNADLTLVGNSQSIAVTGNTTVPNLVAGAYVLNAANVSSAGTTYAPTQSTQNITITKQVQSVATVTYAVLSTEIDLVLDQAYLTQAAQKMDGTVSLVVGRDALLRVFAHADRNNALTPTVRARIYDGATLLQTLTLTGPVGGVPIAIDETVMGTSWNTVIPAVNIRTATRILVDIDPTNAIAEADETNNIWPRNGMAQALSVLTAPVFNVRFVPVTVGGLTGNVTAGNMNSFLVTSRLIWPIQTVSSDVRAPFTSSADTLVSTDSNGKWLVVLSEMNTLRSTDNAPGTTHYYGVVKVAYNSGVAGYGYVPGRSAIGWDYLPSGDGVAAHEWGHNFNRPHAPCGGASGPDPMYPYTGGIIGTTGWNSSTNALVATSVFDIMGYCNPKWISDYNWTKVMTYRQASGSETTAASTGDGLLVWGRISGSTVILEPSFRVTARATAPSRQPTHFIDALDADGNVVMNVPITAEHVDHVSDRDERHFAVVIPWTSAMEQSLSQIRVRDIRTPLVAALRASATAVAANLSRSLPLITPLAMPDPSATVQTIAGGRTRVQWNTTQYPMAMVRDANTGQVMGYLRTSGATLPVAGRKLEIVYSDGVRSVIRQ